MGLEEGKIQNKRIKQLEREGYFVLKIIKCNKNGIADILALPPNCGAIFCEVKAEKGVVSPLQKYWLKHLKEKFGFITEVFRG